MGKKPHLHSGAYGYKCLVYITANMLLKSTSLEIIGKEAPPHHPNQEQHNRLFMEMPLLKLHILSGRVQHSPKCFLPMEQRLGRLVLLLDTVLALALLPYPPPLLALPSWCLGVGLERSYYTTPHSKRGPGSGNRAPRDPIQLL